MTKGGILGLFLFCGGEEGGEALLVFGGVGADGHEVGGGGDLPEGGGEGGGAGGCNNVGCARYASSLRVQEE